MVYDRHSRMLTLQMKNEQVMAMLHSIGEKVPWVVLGFNPQLAALWKKSRPEFLRAVEQRQKQYEAQQAGPENPV